MRIMILGSGGREHALTWAVAKSKQVEEVIVAPGNPGTDHEPGVRNLALDILHPAQVLQAVQTQDVDLVIVGPEAPLVAGVADALREAGVPVVGPNKDGATLEGSKAFAKDVMTRASVPTASYGEVSTHQEIDAFCDEFDGQALVVKADGLAGGKGVIVCDSVEEARENAHTMLDEQPFGEASAQLVLEERLEGIETSYIVLAAGTDFVAFPTSQDHKALLEGDQGPNTGGMGAYSPAPFVSAELRADIEAEVISPTLEELAHRGIDFRGFLYAGLMLTKDGIRVLEFNVRMGDPETQVLLSALGNDIVPALKACADGELRGYEFIEAHASAIVVLAAEGYPRDAQKGAVISGIQEADALDDVKVFHAGTGYAGSNYTVNGGRVLGVTAVADQPEEALKRAYQGVDRIHWEGVQYRSDIGHHLDE